jgi:hypothetical protein
MASETSANGVIKIDVSDTLTAVGEVTGYSITYTSDTVETTVLKSSDNSRTYLPTLSSYTASIDAMYDYSNDAQKAMFDAITNGTVSSYELYPSGDTSSTLKYSGEGIITSFAVTGSVGEMITATFEVQGTGVLTKATIA